MSAINTVCRAIVLVAWLAVAFPALGQAAGSGRESPDLPAVYRTWETYTTREGLPHDNVLSFCVDAGQLWVGTEGGLALRDEGGAWTSWTAPGGSPSPAITAITVDDRTRDLWLGTWGGGLLRFSGGQFRRFDQLNSGLAGNLVFAVAVEGERVWAATNGGLCALNTRHNTWDLHFERRADAPEIVFTALAVAGHRLYAAAWCAGLWRYDGQQGTWRRLPAAGSAAPGQDSSTLEDTTASVALAEQSLWSCTRDVLLRRPERGTWEEYRIPGSGTRARAAIGALVAVNDHEVWLGADRDVLMLADRSTSTWVRYHPSSGGSHTQVTVVRDGVALNTGLLRSNIPGQRIRCIALLDHDMWVGTDQGLARGSERVEWGELGLRSSASPAGASSANESPGEPLVHGRSSEAASEGLTEVQVGVLRPRARSIHVPGTDSPGVPLLGKIDPLAVSLAVEQATARRGYGGKIPFARATGPEGAFRGWGWTTPEDDFPALADQQGVLGIVGYLGPHTRITSAVALRTEVPLVNTAPTPASADELVNPWIFRCRGDDPRQHRLLLDYVFDRLGMTRVAVVETPSSLGRTHLDWWRRHATNRAHEPVVDVLYDPATGGADDALRAVRQQRAEVVLTWADAATSADLLRRMRTAGMKQLFVGGDQILDPQFLQRLDGAPGAIMALCPRSGRMDHALAADFASDYAARFGLSPPAESYPIYRATNHLLQAIRAAEPRRQAVRRALRTMSHDCNGEAHCEAAPYAPDEFVLARLEDGKWTKFTFAQLSAP